MCGDIKKKWILQSSGYTEFRRSGRGYHLPISIEKNTGFNANIIPTVGNKAVQEAYAGANFYDCDRAMVMTNLTFTRAATELAEKLEVELWDHCPTTRYYSLLFKLMSLMNIVFFLYGILLLFLMQNKNMFPIQLPGDFLIGALLVAASVFGFLGWRFVLCNLAAGGIYLYLSLHTVLLPAITNAAYSDIQLVVLVPTVIYVLHACWLVGHKRH